MCCRLYIEVCVATQVSVLKVDSEKVCVCVCVRGSLRLAHTKKNKKKVYLEKVCVCVCEGVCDYGVASVSRLLKIIGLLCRIKSVLQGSFAKETYDLKESLRIVATPYTFATVIQLQSGEDA